MKRVNTTNLLALSDVDRKVIRSVVKGNQGKEEMKRMLKND